MHLLGRWLLYLILALGVARMVLYLVYAASMLLLPLESHNLEAKMVLLAFRAEHGLSLYPPWWDYPHVSNWFGPVEPLLVGLLGRLLGGDIRGLFLIGRAVSFGSGILTTLVLGVAVGRRYGTGAGLAGGVLSLAAGPMFGFTVMVRPDTLAELLGVGGFLLCDGRSRGARASGVGLLILAVLTKQTAVVFLLAAALAPACLGEWRRGLGVLAAAGLGVLVVVVAVTVLFEPHFARSLAGERIMPWNFAAWRYLLYRVVLSCPDLLILPAIGVWLWLGGRFRPREVRPAILALLLLAAAIGLSGKTGADMNYYLSLRVASAMAAGALWYAVHTTPTRPEPRPPARAAALAVIALLALVSMIPSVLYAAGYVALARNQIALYATPQGLQALRSQQDTIALARNPRVRLLTDSGLLDLYQGERAAFGDPWLFRTLVETGRLRPTRIEERIESQYYDIIITTHDLDSPGYMNQDFRLPEGLRKQARARYVLRKVAPGYFFYGRRPGGKGP